jgi:hypothetical protein
LIYSTDSIFPIAILGNLHYGCINDLVWVGNQKLIASSSDGYCSIISFDEGEENVIGVRLPNDQLPEKLRQHYEKLDQVNYRRLEQETVREKEKKEQ